MKSLPLFISYFTFSEWRIIKTVNAQVLTDDRHGTYVGPPISPTKIPVKFSSRRPSISPLKKTTIKPTTSSLKQSSKVPTIRKSAQPTRKPTWKRNTRMPTVRKSPKPTIKQSRRATAVPMIRMTQKPSHRKSSQPINNRPSRRPTSLPSSRRSRRPTIKKSVLPSKKPISISARPSNRTSKQPSIRRSASPSKKPTRRVTAFPSSRRSKRPSIRNTALPTKRSTRKGTAKPSKRLTKNPTYKSSRRPSTKPSSTVVKSKAPTRIPTMSSSADICTSTSTGNFGIASSDSVVVLYGYQMQISPTADTDGLASKMELAITNIVWPSISSCTRNSTKRALQSNNAVKVSGLSYLPKDAVSDCVSTKKGSTCISVSGKMTVYFAKRSRFRSRSRSVTRYILDLNQAMSDISTSINQIIDSGMKSGQFLSVSSDIQGITYVGSGSSQQPQVKQGIRFPAYGYAIIILSIAAMAGSVLAVLMFVQKRSSRRQQASHSDYIDNVSMSDEIQFISDDGAVLQIVDRSPPQSEALAKQLDETEIDEMRGIKGINTLVKTDLEESSSVESNADSNSPLVHAEAVKSESPGHNNIRRQNDDHSEPDGNLNEIDLNRTGSDDSSSSFDTNSKSPLLKREEDKEYGDISNKSFDEQHVLASGINDLSSDESSLNMKNQSSNDRLIHY